MRTQVVNVLSHSTKKVSVTTERIRKSVAVKVTDTGADTGSFEAILSTPDIDRDGESVKSSEWKSLPDSIPINVDHEMGVTSMIGSATPSFDTQGNLVIQGTYSSLPLAQDVRTLVNEGHLKTMSVEFMRTVTPIGDKSFTTERELIGGAYTPYPSNVNARVLASKSGARNNATDAKNIQAIHDGATALGAACDVIDEKSITHRSTKALSGSVEDMQARIEDSLTEFYGSNPDNYVWICATFLDTPNSGSIVYEFNGDRFSQAFTDDGSSATVDGAPKDVSLVTSVVLEDDDTEKSATDSAADETAADDVAAKSGLELLAQEFEVLQLLTQNL